MNHHAFEQNFADALIAPVSRDHSKRFAVYRNNVFVGLVEALRSRYPAIENAVGSEFFNALARDYVAVAQPSSPVMCEYGETFPDFVDKHPALDDYRWLGDVARLERAMTSIYHARDQIPVAASDVAKIDINQLEVMMFEFVDACAIVDSTYPVVTLWQMNSGLIEPASINDFAPESAFIFRDGFDVAVKALTQSEALFLTMLRNGTCLGEATELVLQNNAQFDPSSPLTFAITSGLIAKFYPNPSEDKES